LAMSEHLRLGDMHLLRKYAAISFGSLFIIWMICWRILGISTERY